MKERKPMPKTILIVDDEPNVLWFVSKICQPLGYETLTASSGMEALKIIQECGGKLDLVLLDLKMPGMGGIEVLKSIRKHQPDLAVIILTALQDEREECESLGIEGYVTKPYSLEDLSRRIVAVLERKVADKSEVVIPDEMEPCAKILIVDDETEVCELLGTALVEDVSDCHFEVKWALSGDEALRISREFEPDIGIVDIKMPHMWGDELIERFKRGEGHSPKDFVIYTSVSNESESDRAKKLGYKMLSKPTQIETVVEILKKICIRHKLLRKKA